MLRALAVKIFILSIGLIAVGCVGTVSETQPAFNKSVDSPGNKLVYSGVESLNAISNSRIEVTFPPATGGSGFYAYNVYVGSDPIPQTFTSDVLTLEYDGTHKVTVKNLTQSTEYKIRVEVVDYSNPNGVESNSERVLVATTFRDLVADFDGVISLSNVEGIDAKDSIRVSWSNARSSFLSQDWHPDRYEIVVIVADGDGALRPTDMDTPQAGRFVYTVNHNDLDSEYIARGLPSNTEFFVRVRAIHKGSIEDVFDPRKRSELNTKVLKIKTLSEAVPVFNDQSLAVSLSSGASGLTSVNVTWQPAIGVFDHYRIYYRVSPGVFGATGGGCTDTGLEKCKKVPFSATSTQVTGLSPYTDYRFQIKVCVSSRCDELNSILYSRAVIRKTDPSFPNFSGVTGIKLPESIEELGTLQLQFSPPDFLLGFFDELKVLVRRSVAPGAGVVITEFPSGGQSLFVTPFDFLNQNYVVINGIDYLSDQPYCFALVPFSNGVQTSQEEQWFCYNQSDFENINNLSFIGIDNVFRDLATNSVTILFTPPGSGIFSHYELFIKEKDLDSFSLSEAILQAPGTKYRRVLIPKESIALNQTIIGGLDDAVEYEFAILTYYEYLGTSSLVKIRSELDASTIFSCPANSSSCAAY
jgi:hypothetical protein